MTEPIRTVPPKGAASSVDGEEIPAGAEPDHPEATPDLEVGERPNTEEPTGLVLDVD